MALRKWFQKLWGNERLKPAKDMRVLRTDTTNTANILARARDPEQVEKVTIAIQQIEQVWTEKENRELAKAMLIFDETYPHLEKMADLEPLSAEWLAEWTKAMEVATKRADELMKEQEED